MGEGVTAQARRIGFVSEIWSLRGIWECVGLKKSKNLIRHL